MNPLSEWKKLQTFLDDNQQFTKHQVRWLCLHRETNGFSSCVRKVGKSLYFNETKIAEWMEGSEN